MAKRANDTGASWISKMRKKEEGEYEDYEDYDEGDYQELENKLKATKKENELMKQKLMECVKSLKDLSAEKEQLEHQLSQEKVLPNHYQNIEVKLNESKMIVRKLVLQKEELTVELEKERKIQDQNSEKISKQLKQSQEQLSQLTTLNRQLEKQNLQLVAEKEDYQLAAHHQGKFAEKAQALQIENRELKIEYEREIKEVHLELIEVKKEVDQRQIENEQLTNQLFENQSKETSYVDLEAELKTAQKRVIQLKQDNEQICYQLDHSKNEIADVMIEAKVQARKITEQANLEVLQLKAQTQKIMKKHRREAVLLVSQVDQVKQDTEDLFIHLKENISSISTHEIFEDESI